MEVTLEGLQEVLKSFGDELRKDLNQRFDRIEQRIEHVEKEIADLKKEMRLVRLKVESHEEKFEEIGRAALR